MEEQGIDKQLRIRIEELCTKEQEARYLIVNKRKVGKSRIQE